MQGKLIQQHMRAEDLTVVVTAFKAEKTGADGDVDSGALRVNFCCAKISENIDVIVSREQQIDMIGTWGLMYSSSYQNHRRGGLLTIQIVVVHVSASIGRPVSEFSVKEAREVALKKLLERIGIQVVVEGDGSEKKRHLSIDLNACKGKAWLRAYQALKPQEMIARPRPRGHPM